jgi:predicted SAM-dependent methyltransferase
MKIEFGCGETPTKTGFKTCDIRDLPGVDFVCPAWKIVDFVEKDSVSEIFSRHFFEHLTFIQGESVLEAWIDILCPGGKMEMILPNMTFHIKQWQNRKTEKEFNHAKAGFWGWQREGETNLWDTHKSGYDYRSLSDLLIRKGFDQLENLSSDDNRHLHVRCIKSRK